MTLGVFLLLVIAAMIAVTTIVLWPGEPEEIDEDILISSNISKMVREVVDDFTASDEFRRLVMAIGRQNPRFMFVKRVQQRLLEASSTMNGRDSFNCAARIVREYLADEQIEFGDARYSWDRDAARTLAVECEISYWENSHDEG